MRSRLLNNLYSLFYESENNTEESMSLLGKDVALNTYSSTDNSAEKKSFQKYASKNNKEKSSAEVSLIDIFKSCLIDITYDESWITMGKIEDHLSKNSALLSAAKSYLKTNPSLKTLKQELRETYSEQNFYLPSERIYKELHEDDHIDDIAKTLLEKLTVPSETIEFN